MKKVPRSFEEFNTDLVKKVDRMMVDGIEEKSIPVQEIKTEEAKIDVSKYAPTSTAKMTLDQAVDDITHHESDQILEDSSKTTQPTVTKPKNKKSRRKTIMLAIGLVVGLLIIGIILAYFFFKPTGSISLYDYQNNSLISDANIKVDGKNYVSNSNGQANVKFKLGNNKLVISKANYTNLYSSVFVFWSGKKIDYKLKATGRTISFKVINSIDNSAVSGASISFGSSQTTTSSSGSANLVVPTSSNNISLSISSTGFNTVQVSSSITNLMSSQNLIKLVPTGQIYYLSNASNGFNVMSANLDGSKEKVVLPSTGNENIGSENLYASSDWNYLVLQSDRTAQNQQGLYIIDTSNNNFSEFDSNNSYSPIGWIGHDFVYLVTSSTLNSAQPGYEQIKVYNALTNEISLLDSSQVSGTATNYAYQNFSNFIIVNGNLFYTSSYLAVGTYDLSTLNDTVNMINSTTLAKTSLLTLAANTVSSLKLSQDGINHFNLTLLNATSNQNQYYSYDQNNQTLVSTTISPSTINYSSFFLSANNNYYWMQSSSSGQNQIYTASISSPSPKLIGTTIYSLVGLWNNYLLLMKNNTFYLSPISNLTNLSEINNASAGNIVKTYFEIK